MKQPIRTVESQQIIYDREDAILGGHPPRARIYDKEIA